MTQVSKPISDMQSRTEADELREFNQFVAEMMPKLINHLLRTKTNGDIHWAEDIAQETFATLWNKRRTVRKLNWSWIKRVAENLYFNDYHRRKRVTVVEEVFTAAEPDDDLDFSLTRIDMQHKIRRLSRIDRMVFLLRSQHLSYQEIAARLGIPIGTVKSRLHRCRKIIESLEESSCG